MKAIQIHFLKSAEKYFEKAMKQINESDSLKQACKEVADYIAAHQAAGVYIIDEKKAIMYCEGVKLVLRRALPNLWVIVAVKYIGHMPISWPIYVLKRIKRGAYERFCRVVDCWRWHELPIPTTSC